MNEDLKNLLDAADSDGALPRQSGFNPNQMPLPAVPPTKNVERPAWHSDEIVRATALKLLPNVMRWLEDEQADEEDVLDDLITAIDQGFSLDGYALTEALDDDCSWEVNAELVEIMDRAEMHWHEAYNDAVKAWVIAFEIKPALGVGDIVVFDATDDRSGKRVDVRAVGEIIEVSADVAQYVVRSRELGHVTEEQAIKNGGGTIGLHLKFEDVQPWEGERKGGNADA